MKYVKRNIFANIVTTEGKMFLLIFVIFSRYIEILNLTLNVFITAKKKKNPKKLIYRNYFEIKRCFIFQLKYFLKTMHPGHLKHS